MPVPLALLHAGMTTSVGMSAPAACAAIRAGLTNPTETRFLGANGEWIMAHSVAFEEAFRGLAKLTKMAVMTIEECLAPIPKDAWARIALFLCIAERDRPGRIDGIDEQLFAEIQRELDVDFAPGSAIFAHGRVSAGLALVEARQLLGAGSVSHVLIVGVDSFLNYATLSSYIREDRLLTAGNSNGFMAGEGAAAILVGQRFGTGTVLCSGIGVAEEHAGIWSEEPLRGNGLTQAIKLALAEAGCDLFDVDYRITDLSGEQYYFKEASLALNRILRKRKVDFDLWHPAESIGEVGAASGVVCLAVARMAALGSYAPGPRVLLHFGNDSGLRSAVIAAVS
jgi:3-oxoacyl-[acyl-carrier-protein] synthase I